MFAYCFYDKSKDLLSFVTDPQGEKKLFIYNDKKYFIVSSTILAIKNFIKLEKINYDVLSDYFLTRHFLFHKKTIYKNLSISKIGGNLEYNLKTHKHNYKKFFNIFSLIKEKKYNSYKNDQYTNVLNNFEQLMTNRLKTMIPNRKFASVFSGGVDSSLISVLLSKIKKPNLIACLDHKRKDNTIRLTKSMSKKVDCNFFTRSVTSKQYFLCLKKVYHLICHPFSTHDFVGRYQISKFFNIKNCKVYFVADGADELFGGYEKYKVNNWKNFKNCSPYSIFQKVGSSDLENYIDLIWRKAYLKYKKFLNKYESSIQASLFTDYFVQCVSVGNIGTDIMSGENSLEPRTPFIQKDIIEFAVNLPLKYKIDYKSKNKNFITKPILKKIFLNNFNKSFYLKT